MKKILCLLVLVIFVLGCGQNTIESDNAVKGNQIDADPNHQEVSQPPLPERQDTEDIDVLKAELDDLIGSLEGAEDIKMEADLE